jgi:cation diffusion facilitator family transporter
MTDAAVENLDNDYAAKRRVTVVCAAGNLFLSVVKIVIGVIGHSQALIADGIHSLSDLASDGLVLVAVKFGSQAADEEHPYGHARFETVATVGLGALLLLVAIGVIVDAGERMASPEKLLQPGVLALAAAIVSILANEWMYRYSLRVAREVNSSLMRANAWHHRSDALSSIIALLGIAGTMAGVPWLDAVGAIGVAVLVGKVGWDLGWNAVRELVDTGVSGHALEDIRATIESVDGVRDFHKLRTRRMGDRVLVEAHVLVGNQVTVSEGHMISDRVRARLLADHDDIAEALIHIDPEDDAVRRPSSDLPGRPEVLRALEACWQPLHLAGKIQRVNLHYLEGKIDVELILPLDVAGDVAAARRLADDVRKRARQTKHIGRVAVYFR